MAVSGGVVLRCLLGPLLKQYETIIGCKVELWKWTSIRAGKLVGFASVHSFLKIGVLSRCLSLSRRSKRPFDSSVSLHL